MRLFRFNCFGMVTKTDFRHIRHLEYFSPAATASNIFIVHQKEKSHLLCFDNFLDVLAVLAHHLFLLFGQSLITSSEGRGDSRLLSITSSGCLFVTRFAHRFVQKHTSSRCCLNMFTVWRCNVLHVCAVYSFTGCTYLAKCFDRNSSR